MSVLLWDASALIKRYLIESGSETVDALWAAPNVAGMAVAALGYAETASILRRKYNSGILPIHEFQAMRLLLRQETLDNQNFVLLTVDPTILDAMALIDRHNINASDGAILAAFLRFARFCALLVPQRTPAFSSPPISASCGRPRRKGWRRSIPKHCPPPMCLRSWQPFNPARPPIPMPAPRGVSSPNFAPSGR